MREARVILPEGQPIVHEALAAQLASQYGGYTAVPIMGGWINPAGELEVENGTAYDVAMDDDEESRARLLELALRIGREAGEHSMYVRLPDGEVRILETEAASTA